MCIISPQLNIHRQAQVRSPQDCERGNRVRIPDELVTVIREKGSINHCISCEKESRTMICKSGNLLAARNVELQV